MASSMISPLRLAWYPLTSINTGRALTTNSVTNNLALQEKEHVDVHRLHNEVMQQRSHQVSALHQKKCSLITKQSPLHRQTQQRQLDSEFQGVRSLHTSKCSQASLTSESLTTQEADDEYRRHHKEAMEYWVIYGFCPKPNEGFTHQQTGPPTETKSAKTTQFQSVRYLHTKIRISDFVGEVHEEEERHPEPSQ
ncbi:unnamed protein product [Meganyctiphanes norvegica]|uniref:Uncharacterized protein n=1 Tax=Meganyctiphanes norvegica TaxID=48144 RepID=A0AAV2PWU8_MEGNR